MEEVLTSDVDVKRMKTSDLILVLTKPEDTMPMPKGMSNDEFREWQSTMMGVLLSVVEEIDRRVPIP